MARKLLALSPSARDCQPIINEHGVDILFGGHDHLYYICKGAGEWEGHDRTEPVLGADGDHSDVLALKSGSDFRDLSEMALELEGAPEGSVRRMLIKNLTGAFSFLIHDYKKTRCFSWQVNAILFSRGWSHLLPWLRS